MRHIAVIGEGHLADATRDCVANVFFYGRSSLEKADLVWFCVDTPVDEETDHPDVQAVYIQLVLALANIRAGTPILISSQLPVGTCAKWEELNPEHHFMVQPENIRKAHAVEDFKHQHRMILGTRHPEDNDLIVDVLWKFTDEVIIMSPESAEMTKHALNAFLAMEIAFANEIAEVCDLVGASKEDVFKGFRSDIRVGFAGPLSPGGPYKGGTLGRDIRVLIEREAGVLIKSIDESNSKRIEDERRKRISLDI